MTEKQVDNLFFKQVLCGAGAGAFTKTTTAPLERIKILYQLQGMQAEGVGKNRKYRNIFLGENMSETRKKIKTGDYELIDLN